MKAGGATTAVLRRSCTHLCAKVMQPGNPATRQPGNPATRQPGNPATRQPGNPATRQPGNPATRQPGNPATRQPGNPATRRTWSRPCLSRPPRRRFRNARRERERNSPTPSGAVIKDVPTVAWTGASTGSPCGRRFPERPQRRESMPEVTAHAAFEILPAAIIPCCPLVPLHGRSGPGSLLPSQVSFARMRSIVAYCAQEKFTSTRSRRRVLLHVRNMGRAGSRSTSVAITPPCPSVADGDVPCRFVVRGGNTLPISAPPSCRFLLSFTF